jgi:hypothetical protein
MRQSEGGAIAYLPLEGGLDSGVQQMRRATILFGGTPMADNSSSSVASVAIVIIVILAAFAFYFMFGRSGGKKVDIDVTVPKVNQVVPAPDYSPMQAYTVISG